jgi:hypothetical protein
MTYWNGLKTAAQGFMWNAIGRWIGNLSQSSIPSFADVMAICQLANQRWTQQHQLPLDHARLAENV